MGKNRKDVHHNSQEENKVGPQQGTGIRCPSCDGIMKVKRTDARPNESVQGRFRSCSSCGHRVYTEERITVPDVDEDILKGKALRAGKVQKDKNKKSSKQATRRRRI